MDLSLARDNVVDALDEFLTLINAPCVSHTLPPAPDPILPPIPQLRHLDSVPSLAWIPNELDDKFTAALRDVLSEFDVIEGRPCGPAAFGDIIRTAPNTFDKLETSPGGVQTAGTFPECSHLDADSRKSIFMFLVQKDWLHGKYRDSLFHKTMYDMATERAQTRDTGNPDVVVLDDKHMDGGTRLSPFARIIWQIDCLAAQASTNADNHVAHYALWESQPFHDDPDKHPYKIIESLVLTYGQLSFAERIKVSVVLFHRYHPLPLSRDLARYTTPLLAPGYLFPKGFESKMFSMWIKNRRNNFWEHVRGTDWQK